MAIITVLSGEFYEADDVVLNTSSFYPCRRDFPLVESGFERNPLLASFSFGMDGTVGTW
jgi:hypothetical protein